MNHRANPFQVVDIPLERRGMAAFQELKAGRHVMYALLEVDVTVARKFIEEYAARTGEQLSFTGFLISCLAQAVEFAAPQDYRHYFLEADRSVTALPSRGDGIARILRCSRRGRRRFIGRIE